MVRRPEFMSLRLCLRGGGHKGVLRARARAIDGGPGTALLQVHDLLVRDLQPELGLEVDIDRHDGVVLDLLMHALPCLLLLLDRILGQLLELLRVGERHRRLRLGRGGAGQGRGLVLFPLAPAFV